MAPGTAAMLFKGGTQEPSSVSFLWNCTLLTVRLERPLGTARYSQCVRKDRSERERQSAHGGLQGAGGRATARKGVCKAEGQV